MSDVLKIQGLKKRYGKFEALKGLDLSIPKGQCVGLLGSNGAGKSTTIRIITGQLRPSAGAVEVLGINPVLEPKKVHPHIGYIPDQPTLYDELSIRENVEIFARLFGCSSKDVDPVLERFSLLERSKDLVKNLSKGLKQKVLIARALVHEPSFVILDEPTTGLDPHSAEEVYRLLEELKNKGTTILLTTHLMNDVERLCDHIVFINKGEKVEEGSPAQLKIKYSTPKIDVVVNSAEGLQSFCIEKDNQWVNRLSDLQKKGEIVQINSHLPKLEEIFIRLIGGDA